MTIDVVTAGEAFMQMFEGYGEEDQQQEQSSQEESQSGTSTSSVLLSSQCELVSESFS